MEKKVNKEKSKIVFNANGKELNDVIISIMNNIILNKNSLELDFDNSNIVKLYSKD